MTTQAGASGVKRRDFLKIVGAGTAATAAVGCTSENVGRLIPYVAQPDQTVSGITNYYATVCREGGGAAGVYASVRDGRVYQLSGNPSHPASRGALSARSQAALQGVYNPDRYRAPMIRQEGQLRQTTWDRALAVLSQQLGTLRSRGQAANAVFINQAELGSFPGFLDQWLAAFGLPAHVSYDAEAPLAVMAANRASYGGVAWPRVDFGASRLIVSFSADFLDHWGNVVPQQLDWADARAKLEGAPRMIYVGPRRSLTGLNADEWIPARAGTELAIVNLLRGQLGAAAAAQQSGVSQAVLERLAQEVTAAGNGFVALAGSTASNAGELATAVNALNASAGAVGRAIRPDQALPTYARVASHADVRALVDRMNAGAVPLVMVRGANPAYSSPAQLQFAQAFRKVPFKVSFSSYPDETSELADLVLPDHHPLEAWGDAEAGPGQVAIQQPTMDPVFDTRQTADALLSLAHADPTTAARFPQASYRAFLMGRFPGGAAGWTAASPKGVAAGTVLAASAATSPARAAARHAPALASTEGDYDLVVYPHSLLGDG
ncbi:MAG TPA: molybdopterin-dependent oxidoreductase, partial [Gemmatirosa sp.]